MTSSHRIVVLLLMSLTTSLSAFVVDRRRTSPCHRLEAATGDNKAMQFLKKIGKVGGVANKDYRYGVGADEGPAGRTMGSRELRKTSAAFVSCVDSAIVDDMTEAFPVTKCGTRWSGFSDQVMGGRSTGSLSRQVYQDRTANVLRGSVSLENNGGFVQMATNLASAVQTSASSVDASAYDGVELDLSGHVEGTSKSQESFNVHLKTTSCIRPFSSYRATFQLPLGSWQTIQIPWSDFVGHGPGAADYPFDSSSLTRAGIVAIGKEMEVTLAVSGLRFYKA